MVKDLNYWKNNCEEDYIHTPISVLRYISELEKSSTENETDIDLKKELLEFLEANNNFGLEEPEKIVDIYIKVYKEGLGVNYFNQQEQPKPIQEGKTKSNSKPFTVKGRQAPPPPVFKRTRQQEQ